MVRVCRVACLQAKKIVINVNLSSAWLCMRTHVPRPCREELRCLRHHSEKVAIEIVFASWDGLPYKDCNDFYILQQLFQLISYSPNTAHYSFNCRIFVPSNHCLLALHEGCIFIFANANILLRRSLARRQTGKRLSGPAQPTCCRLAVYARHSYSTRRDVIAG